MISSNWGPPLLVLIFRRFLIWNFIFKFLIISKIFLSNRHSAKQIDVKNLPDDESLRHKAIDLQLKNLLVIRIELQSNEAI